MKGMSSQSTWSCLPFIINTPSRTVRTTLVILLLLLSQQRLPTKTEMYLQHHLRSCKDYKFLNKMKAGLQIYCHSALYYTAIEMLQVLVHRVNIQQGHTAPSWMTGYIWMVSYLCKKWTILEHWWPSETSPVMRLLVADQPGCPQHPDMSFGLVIATVTVSLFVLFSFSWISPCLKYLFLNGLSVEV